VGTWTFEGRAELRLRCMVTCLLVRRLTDIGFWSGLRSISAVATLMGGWMPLAHNSRAGGLGAHTRHSGNWESGVDRLIRRAHLLPAAEVRWHRARTYLVRTGSPSCALAVAQRNYSPKHSWPFISLPNLTVVGWCNLRGPSSCGVACANRHRHVLDARLTLRLGCVA